MGDYLKSIDNQLFLFFRIGLEFLFLLVVRHGVPVRCLVQMAADNQAKTN
jgi:hypothetical protein